MTTDFGAGPINQALWMNARPSRGSAGVPRLRIQACVRDLGCVEVVPGTTSRRLDGLRASGLCFTAEQSLRGFEVDAVSG